ncbi:Hint domain-containing protein [Roseivivax sp. CAU 1761]
MSWIALFTNGTGWTCPYRLASPSGPAGNWLERGALMLEFAAPSGPEPCILLGLATGGAAPRTLGLQMRPDGTLVLVLEQDNAVFHAVLAGPPRLPQALLRLTFCWDAPAGRGRLTLERPQDEVSRTIATPPPPALHLADLRRLADPDAPGCHRDPALVYLAASDAAEPVGRMPGLTAATPVLTPAGPRPVAELRPGDTVLTRDAGPQPVLAVLSRTVPAYGAFRPVHVRAPALGLAQDLVVAPGQRLVMAGPDVEYTFGCETVAVPAETLLGGGDAGSETRYMFLRYHQVLLPRHAALLAAGIALDSFYAGRLRRDRGGLDRSLLAGIDPALLPEQVPAPRPVLRRFEALTLAQARVA